jgi:uncharacterized membrane protein YgcG
MKERDEMVNLVDALDDVLARVATGEAMEGCLARYPELAVELTQLVKVQAQLSVIAPVPALSVDTLAARRRQFLTTARTYKRQAASVHPFQRFMAWVWPVQRTGPPAQRTGRPAFVPVLAQVAIAFVLVLSIVGGTVAAAQSSLPDSPLYGIKLTVEDARLNLTSDPAQQATLAMTFASERTHEMERLTIAHRPIGSHVSLRLQNQLDAALSAAARAPEPEMLRLLDQVRSMAQTQERALSQAQINAPREPSTQEALRQAEQAIAQAQQQAESGLTDPDAFRNRYRHQQGAPMQPTPEATATPQPPASTTVPQLTATLEATVTPQPSHTPQASVTPQRNQAGTGQPPTSAPGPEVTGTPQQTGPGPQPTAGQAGPGPQATDTPEGYPGGKPGDGSGSGGGTGGSGGSGSGGGTRRP